MSSKQKTERLDKRAKALRDNLKKRKAAKKEQASKAKDNDESKLS